ncbi:tRNA (adenosine(37)-N6)-dimethylallyltransferase MiaA [Candidatus Saccharibacteria bacterium]|nr:tRNA (adenosine(37)-N6)-dimethylallyltransferase MiaA [Candidatus Saccharibacteria bacterium]
MATKLPLVVIVGPTASGKTSLAIKLARKYQGEIICADSRTVYRDMDVGTAKPTSAERALVPHWGLDVVSPGERFTAADFKRYALAKIAEIRARGHVPFLVGGTGLYVDGVVFDYEFGSVADDSERQRLDVLSIEELHEYCFDNNIKLPENDKNKRHIIRAIERRGKNGRRRSDPISTSVIVGISTDRDLLRTRIEHRAEQLFENGVVEESIMLGKRYGWDSEAMTGNIYPLVRRYLDKELSMMELQQRFVILDWRLAKRQLTWLKRNKFIQWKPLVEAEHYLSELLVESANS